MTRSLQIRSLSMPPERLDENASHFYQQFNDNFMRIKALIRENREVLDTRVYRLLKKYPDISEQDADKLIEFSDALADTRTLEMVDVQLAWMIVNVLEPYYDTLRREKSDPEYTYKYIHCLFRHQALSYNVVQLCDRGRTTDPLSERYRACISDCSKKMVEFIADTDEFAKMPLKTRNELITLELFSATCYERLYYDEKLIRKQIECYKWHISRLTAPGLKEKVPDMDLDFDLFSAYTYLAQVNEFMYWNDVPGDILDELYDAVNKSLDYAKSHPDNYRVDPGYVMFTKKSIECYMGRVSVSEMMEEYEQRQRESDMNSYDFMNIDANLLPLIFTLWMCRRHPEKTAECTEFLRSEQKRTFEYIRNARDNGAYHTMQRFFSYIMTNYIDVEGGVPFKEYYENALIAMQPTLYVHSCMTAKISTAILDTLYEHKPELLIHVNGYDTMEEVKEHYVDIRRFLWNCCMMHDVGKMVCLDTVNLFQRMLFSDEFELIKLHPAMGRDILVGRASTRPYAYAALYHHKWYDDKGGYPSDVSYIGVENAILYQIITCSDCIDAATDAVGRTYISGKTIDDMVTDMRINEGRMFNPDLVGLFSDKKLYSRVEELVTRERESTYYSVFNRAEREARQNA